MKRSPELRELSVDHHHGLVAARRLRWAEAGREPLEPALEFFASAWSEEIEPHFRLEEEVLLPRLVGLGPTEDSLVERTRDEHANLRIAVKELYAVGVEGRLRQAGIVGRALDEHIRFEERVLFPALETALAGEPLRSLHEALETARDRASGAPSGCRR